MFLWDVFFMGISQPGGLDHNFLYLLVLDPFWLEYAVGQVRFALSLWTACKDGFKLDKLEFFRRQLIFYFLFFCEYMGKLRIYKYIQYMLLLLQKVY